MRRLVTFMLLGLAGCAHTPCDLNEDGKVGEMDFKVFQWAFGSKKGDHNYMPGLDYNHDGSINGLDFEAYTKQCRG